MIKRVETEIPFGVMVFLPIILFITLAIAAIPLCINGFVHGIVLMWGGGLLSGVVSIGFLAMGIDAGIQECRRYIGSKRIYFYHLPVPVPPNLGLTKAGRVEKNYRNLSTRKTQIRRELEDIDQDDPLYEPMKERLKEIDQAQEALKEIVATKHRLALLRATGKDIAKSTKELDR